MIEELDLLVRLQRIDTKLQAIKSQKGDLPVIVEQLKLTIAQLQNDITLSKNREKEIVL